MKKKTILIVSLVVILLVLVIAAIATFPSHLFDKNDNTASDQQNSTTASQGYDEIIIGGNGVGGGEIDSNVNESNSNNTSNVDGNTSTTDDINVNKNDAGDKNANGNGIEAVLPDIDELLGENGTQSNVQNNANTNKPNNNQDKLEVSPEGTSNLNLETVSEIKNAAIKSVHGAFPKNTKVTLKKLGLFNKDYYVARSSVKSIAKNFVAINYSAKANGKDVLPVDLVQMVINIPDNYNIDNLDVYYLMSNGKVQKLPFAIEKAVRTVILKANITGTYILVEKKTTNSEDSNNKEDAPSNEASEPDSGNSSDVGTNPSEDASSNESSTPSEDTSSENNSSTESSTSSEDTSSDDTTSNESSSSEDSTSSENNSSSGNSSSGSTSSDPNKESMNGWTPWF